MEKVVNLAAETTLTKFPVYEGDLDHIVGVVYVKDVIRYIQIEEVSDALELSLDDPYYTTIGGLVMGKLDRVPTAGDEIVLRDHNVRLKVMEMDGLRVSLLRLSSEGQPPPSED